MRKKGKFTAYNLALVILVVILLGIYVGKINIEYHQNAEDEESSSQAQESPPNQGITPFVTQNPPVNESPPIVVPNEPEEIITASEEDYDRLEYILPQNEIIQLLPASAKIKLSFYNFNSGYREWERTYILTTGKAVQGEASLSEVDMALIMHSRNLPLLKEDNFCEVINGAQKNGDFAMETEKSKIFLGWKYRNMLSYKDCLGL